MSTSEAMAEQFLDGLGEMAQARADAETRAATAEQRVKELEKDNERMVRSSQRPISFDRVELLVRIEGLHAEREAAEARAAELLEEHRRSLACFERLEKYLDTIGLRSELPLVRASVEATRKVIAKAEVSR